MKRQHLIDPEVCIRCGTCEATCSIGAVSHDDTNYVVDVDKCNACLDCIAPCPTGSIDNWRIVAMPYSLAEQLAWTELPRQEELGEASAVVAEALEAEAGALLEAAHAGAGGRVSAPRSASKPVVNLYSRSKPARATVQGNFRITAAEAESDVRHLVLGFGETVFPVLEGQSIGIIPPVTDADGRPQPMRLYSVASARDGEKRNANNLALTVKRVPGGLVSDWLCNLKVGASVEIAGPFGSTFLMPDDPAADIIMICTGTGSAPFRAFTERRRRAASTGAGKLILYFGARTPHELPYFGPLQKVPSALLEQRLVFSRLPDTPKRYVQDRMREDVSRLVPLMHSPSTHIFICGLRGMEAGVDQALNDVCAEAGVDWAGVRGRMRDEGRYHVETY